MAYIAYDVSDLPRARQLGTAETIEDASKLAAKRLGEVFGARPYTVTSIPDPDEDGLDIFAYAGVDTCLIAINRLP